MDKFLFFLLISFLSIDSTNACFFPSSNDNLEVEGDTSRLAELDQFWKELSRTVAEGDFEGYKATYHEDAIVVFATRKDKVSMSISKALAGWKEGFEETREGKVSSKVEFRLSQRINDENTAHETGIFRYSSGDPKGGNETSSYIHFEMLMIKRDGAWLGMMELQRSVASKAEWDALN